MSVKNLRELVQAEYDLTIAIQRAEKFIDTEADGNTNTSRSGDFPKSMLEVKEILSLAYTYSSRTSAPIGLLELRSRTAPRQHISHARQIQ